MDKQKEKKLSESIEKILLAVESLEKFEWSRIVSIIDCRYKLKADKVQFDGNDMILLEKELKHEILDEPLSLYGDSNSGELNIRSKGNSSIKALV
jgi:hypothetical protein